MLNKIQAYDFDGKDLFWIILIIILMVVITIQYEHSRKEREQAIKKCQDDIEMITQNTSDELYEVCEQAIIRAENSCVD